MTLTYYHVQNSLRDLLIVEQVLLSAQATRSVPYQLNLGYTSMYELPHECLTYLRLTILGN